MGADDRLFLCYSRNFYGNLLKWLLFGLFRRLPIEGTFSRWVLMTTLLQRIVNGCQMAFFDAYQVEG